jgi:protein involved in polysaccharide export with SLBB domain
MKRYQHIILTFILLILPALLSAQFSGIDLQTVDVNTLSKGQIEQINNEITGRGLSISEALNLAKAQGLSDTEANKLNQRLLALSNTEEFESGSGGSTEVAQIANETEVSVISNTDEVEEIPSDVAIPNTVRTVNPEDLPDIAPPSDERALMDPDEMNSEIYGHAIFTDQTLDFFTTTDAARAPDWYVLGSGDQVRVTIFGVSQTDLLLEISDDGYVQPSGGSRIFLKGLTIREAESILRDRLSNNYTYASDEFSVTIKSARTITVNIFGEARARGGFTISALNTAFNALTAAGGPTTIGSVRDIQLIRDDERISIDVYKFMDNPEFQQNFDLRHNDIIFVPIAKKVVDLRGAVKRPMRYELTENEDLEDLIRFAGGINFNTATDFVQIERILDGEPVLLEFNLSEILSGDLQIALSDGDIIRLKQIGKGLKDYVDVEGSVYFPGRYSLNDRPTLRKLLEKAQLRPEAKTDKIFIERTQTDNTIKILPIKLDSLLSDSLEFNLFSEDRVLIFDQERYRNVATLTVSGMVKSPFQRSMPFDERIRLDEALELAGGLQPIAIEQAYIKRRNLFNPEEITVIPINLLTDNGFIMQPGDILQVYNKLTYTNTDVIQVVGNVRNPMELRLEYDEQIQLSDMIFMAGGLQPTAIDQAYIQRRNLFNPEEVEVIAVNIAQEGDFQLQPGDVLRVYDKPTFTDTEIVQVVGNIRNPMEIRLDYDETIKLADLLFMAGGLSPVAAETGYVFRRDLINTDYREHIPVNLLQEGNFELKPGDQLRVYNQSNYTDAGELSIGGAVNEAINMPFDSSIEVKDLLIMASGLQRGASKEKVEVYRLNITMEDGISFSTINLYIDDSLNVIKQPNGFQLQPFDRVVVRRIPEFFINANVDINGEVKYPGNYPLENRNIRLSDIVKDAGGLTNSADPENAVLLRNAGNVGPIAINLRKALNNKGSDAHDPVIFDGDIISIPRYDNRINIRLNATRIGELTGQNLVDTTGTIATNETINVVFKGKHSAKWYIENHVGGFATEADKWSVTVTKPNGEVKGTKRRLLLFKDYPTVTPGSTIALRNEIPEPERTEPIIDWDEVQTRSIQATTSFLTILILLERLGIQ